MSYAIPPQFETRLERVAKSENVTVDEVLSRVLEAGLERLVPVPAAIPGLSGVPMSDDEAAVMDEVVELAMNSREQRWSSLSRA